MVGVSLVGGAVELDEAAEEEAPMTSTTFLAWTCWANEFFLKRRPDAGLWRGTEVMCERD